MADLKQTRIEYDGPYEEWRVVMDGRRVPFLNGRKDKDGAVHLMLDHRFGLTIPPDHAASTVWFIAQAIAVGLGYACHQTGDMEKPIPRTPFGGTVHGIEFVQGATPPPLAIVQDDDGGIQVNTSNADPDKDGAEIPVRRSPR